MADRLSMDSVQTSHAKRFMIRSRPDGQIDKACSLHGLIRWSTSAAIAASLMLPVRNLAEENWEQCFREPPREYRPEVYWDWMGGLVSKEGITKDLEAL